MELGTLAVTATLLFTTPCYNAAQNDSGEAYCDISDVPLTDLGEGRVYFWPATGGLSYRIATKDLIGQECRPESLTVTTPSPGHVWLTFVDRSGNEGCTTNQVWIGPPITAVEADPRPVATVQPDIRLYDIRGRLVEKPRATGIYWEVTRYPNGKEVIRKRVFVK